MATEPEEGATQPLVPRLVAAGLGAALQAADALVELGVEGVQAVVGRTRAVEGRLDRRYHEAARLGDLRLRHALAGVTGRVGHAGTSAAALVDREIVRPVAESMTPYLIEDLVPKIIDGIMPKIQADVVPAVIEELAGDERIQTMVAMQSKDVVSRGVTEVREASASADDRVEAALGKMFGRHDQGASEPHEPA